MIWLTWRQFRVPALATIAVLAAIAIVLGITGAHLHHLYGNYTVVGHTTCQANGDCDASAAAFLHHYHHLYQWLGTLSVAVPGIIGIFWGPPLIAHELESGSFRLAWTQSVTRNRWLATKVGNVGAASMLTAGLLSLMVTWWARPIDHINMNRFSTTIFSERGLTPIGYAAFGFALGVTAGLLIRRTVPAMATTLFVFVAARGAMNKWARPHLIPPVHANTTITATTNLGFTVSASPGGALQSASVTASQHLPDAWVYSSQVINDAGHAPTSGFLVSNCQNQLFGSGQVRFGSCQAKLAANFHLATIYQPASRYWDLQWAETAAYLGLALVLIGGCFWWLSHRLS